MPVIGYKRRSAKFGASNESSSLGTGETASVYEFFSLVRITPISDGCVASGIAPNSLVRVADYASKWQRTIIPANVSGL
jgi:hypothetical protein